MDSDQNQPEEEFRDPSRTYVKNAIEDPSTGVTKSLNRLSSELCDPNFAKKYEMLLSIIENKKEYQKSEIYEHLLNYLKIHDDINITYIQIVAKELLNDLLTSNNDISNSIRNGKISRFDFISNDTFYNKIETSLKKDKYEDSTYEVLIKLLFNIFIERPEILKNIDTDTYEINYETEITIKLNNNKAGKICTKVPLITLYNIMDNKNSIDFHNEILKALDAEDYPYLRDFPRDSPDETNIYYVHTILQRELLNNENGKEINDYGFIINGHEINNEDDYFLNIISQNIPDFSEPPSLITKKITKCKSREHKLPTFSSKKGTQTSVLDKILHLFKIIHQSKPNKSLINEEFVKNSTFQLQDMFLNNGLISSCSRLIVHYPYLFPFEIRLFLLRSIVMDPKFVTNYYQQQFKNEQPKSYPLPDYILKVSIRRDNLFKDGIKILQKFAKYRIFLEFSFYQEEGTGLGPVREFFSLMSNEFRKKRHRIWRNDENALFPIATARDEYMYALGLFCGKSIQMNIQVDLPFNKAFFDILLNRKFKIEEIDEEYGKRLKEPVSNLVGLFFEYPYSKSNSVDMIQNGKNIIVNEYNASKYKEKLYDFTCGKYIKRKIDKFKEGLSEVINPELLRMFSSEEINRILNGHKELITRDDLERYICFSKGHGNNIYDIKSPQIQYFFNIFLSMDEIDQKLLIKFITGGPSLPIGGLQNLKPPLSISPGDPNYWPSAKTCVSHLTLPLYTTEEMMKERIIITLKNNPSRFDFS